MGYKAGMTHITRDVDKPGSKLHKKETCEVDIAINLGAEGQQPMRSHLAAWTGVSWGMAGWGSSGWL